MRKYHCGYLDGGQLRVTFCRCFNHDLMLMWYDLVNVAQTICLRNEDDALIGNMKLKEFIVRALFMLY
jgi:hypothetical protein